MTKRERVEEALSEWNPDALFFDGFDDAIVGWATQFTKDPVVAYSYGKIIAILSEDMSPQEAREYFDFNIGGSWVGENTPLILFIVLDEEDA